MSLIPGGCILLMGLMENHLVAVVVRVKVISFLLSNPLASPRAIFSPWRVCALPSKSSASTR